MTHEAIFKYFSPGKRMFDWRSTENSPSPLKNKEIHILIVKGPNAAALDAGPSCPPLEQRLSEVQERRREPNRRLTNRVAVTEAVGCSSILSHSLFYFLSLLSLKTRLQRWTRCLDRASCSLSGHRCVLCRRMSLTATLSILSFRC